MKQIRRWIGYILGTLLLVTLAAAGISALSNRNLPSGPETLGVLDPLDKARLAEAFHLKESLGESVWPGWGEMAVPVLIWNRDYSFLVRFPDLPAGWSIVDEDSFLGKPYFRQPTNEHTNFAVQIDDRWTASMATKWETDLFLREMFQTMLPPVVRNVVPYRLLIQPSEVQITGVLHESFHVYQAAVAGERLAAAEDAHRLGDVYWPIDTAMTEDWQIETDLLFQAARLAVADAPRQAKLVDLARQFSETREERRIRHGLSPELAGYECQLEWEEGLAKYIELEVWRRASVTANYQPVHAVTMDPYFKGYTTFEQRWSQELSQMKRQAGSQEETRFYYTGMAQAILLDQLLPGWKSRVMMDGVCLDDLVRAAISPP